ncbi:Type I restriction enzyme R protein N terminus (HSDR_N) [Luteibacter sp. UNC138MFCol5.1]|uniref:type I restriction endonuclease n=1 Tax=Luteibacter sp. UNC138MFCol5.1 TaxID=1502774 RepID=UPI0008CC6B0B|nr:type I restriction endonuclease [Luteibacter sp. UNC138MFCol5.1]SEO93866.1 Type I restriction enzyme R protein N terminus (HSDR_N) [Luteibacter sp. UNC138MFCol5.1]
MWVTTGLSNESDVEQKFIYPLLVTPSPAGMGLPPSVIQTKANIRRLSIGKGAEKKLYYPDYLIVTSGIPVVVVEAKHPSEDLADGYREARLYASELNALYPHDENPTRYVVASNGVELWFGFTDSTEPLEKSVCAELGVYSPAIARLTEELGWHNISKYADKLARASRAAAYFKPRKLLGGVALQNEEVGQNSFGTTVTSAIASVFNPESREDRAHIAKHGYVPSQRRERYIEPIDKVIRAARPPSETHATMLEDTSKPEEVIQKLRQPKILEHKVLLLIGSVGSGKSTFIDYLQEVALPSELRSAIVWCRLNMNVAPVSANEIYTWLREEIIMATRASLPDTDFDDLEVMRRLYGTELSRFSKGVGKLYAGDTAVYDIKLAEELQRLTADRHLTANCHVRFTCGERQKLCMMVLDNCDKKTRDEQLLMFEAAQWLQKEFRCLVILPLRDETYDNHKDQPPLDTALKDLVFRIEPPLFQQVLVKRVQLAVLELSSDAAEKLHYSLPNGFTVEYPKSEQAFYLLSILKSLFEHDRFARRLIVGLAGRNMRLALEIFLDFCKSGYIGDDQIFKIRQSEGTHVLPFHQVATVILRMNRRFYDSDHSYIKNLFAANDKDPSPAFFCRYLIMRWLADRVKTAGPSGLEGYFRKADVKIAVLPYGLSPDAVDREINYLLAAQCVIAEHLRTDSVVDEDLVRLGPAGYVHLDLVGNVNYLAAIAEDTFFDDRIQAERVVKRIKDMGSHLHLKTAVENATEVVDYLDAVLTRANKPHESIMRDSLLSDLTGFASAREALQRVVKTQASDPWFRADKDLPRGSLHNVTVVNKTQHGHFVEFQTGLVGLVHKSNENGIAAFPGDRVCVEVIWVDVIQRKMSLKLMALVAEDAGDVVEGAYSLPLFEGNDQS